MPRWPPFAAAAADELVRQRNRSLADLVRSGRLAAARRLFDSLPSRSAVTWNSLLAGLARRRDPAAARALFDAMPGRDAVAWNTLLSSYTRSHHPEHLAAARRLFDEMPTRDAVSWSTLLSGYARRGLMAEAQRLFDEMPHRNTASWNTMVSGYFAARQPRKALDLFERMPVRDSASLCALVCGLVGNGWLREAEELLKKNVKVQDKDKALDAYNALIAGYGHAGRVGDARRVFDMIPRWQCQGEKHKRRLFERNAVSWNSMMMCYVKAGDVCSARILFDSMTEKDVVSWNTVIAGYARASDMEEAERLFRAMPDPDAVSWNLMMRGFTRKGQVGRARGYFDRMPDRSVVSWNTMISGYEQNGDYDSAVELFAKMQAAGERPDRHSVSAALAACAALAMLRLGTQLHQLVAKVFVPDTATSNALITMYSRCGALVEAKAVFDRMQAQKDFVSWNAMIGGYAHHGLAVEALQFFEAMKTARAAPTHITFVALLNACAHGGLVPEGRRVFDAMVHEYGIAARVEHYAALVNLIGRHGRLEDALAVIDRMDIPPDRAVWGAFLGACRDKKNAPLARVAARALAEAEPESSAPYVLLHNLHVDEGRWASAAAAREDMERHGVVKQPGYSWIELHDNVHAFVSGDTSHPLSEQIFWVLECFDRSLRDCCS